MTLHIFNPDHDLALASGLTNFTSPHAGRQLRYDLGWLPAIWAAEGDEVLVGNEEQAGQEWRKTFKRNKHVIFRSERKDFGGESRNVVPWGWNAALRAQLLRRGLSAECLPTDEQLLDIRLLSHRRTAAQLLPQLRQEGTVGESCECTTEEQVLELVGHFGKAVIKAPWSSSGRGLRFVSAPLNSQFLNLNSQFSTLNSQFSNLNSQLSTLNWLRNIIARQGSVMVEPYYNKVKDFGMEFMSDGQGTVSYLGLSLFHTQNGAYTGNILATERAKRDMLSRYLPTPLLDATQQRICQLLGTAFKDKYQGPFGIDMMVIAPSNLPQLGEAAALKVSAELASPSWGRLEGAVSLHPCVEINLRRTMGHVALAAEQLVNPNGIDDLCHVMRINYLNNSYKLSIQRS